MQILHLNLLAHEFLLLLLVDFSLYASGCEFFTLSLDFVLQLLHFLLQFGVRRFKETGFLAEESDIILERGDLRLSLFFALGLPLDHQLQLLKLLLQLFLFIDLFFISLFFLFPIYNLLA